MDPDTLEITANYSGIMNSKENKEVPFNGTIAGKIVDDLSSFNGMMLSDAEDAEPIEFAANKYYRAGPCSL